MPQPPTTYMGLVQPSEDDDDDVWDTILTALFLLVDAHDHTTGKGAPVPSAGLDIDATLTFNEQRATDLGGVAFDNLASPISSGGYEIFTSGGNFYFRNATTNVQITSGATLNMTTVGGIAGDYTSVTAEDAFVNAQDGYTFKQQVGAAVRQYAKMDSADVRLYEFKAHPTAGVPTNFVGLASPAALAASYTLTMPAALPAAVRPVQSSAGGALQFGGDMALGTNESITLTGTGRFKRTGLTICASLVGGLPSSANVAYDTANHYVASTGAGTYTIAIPIRDNLTITQVDVEVYGNGACNIASDAFKLDAAGVYYTASVNSTPGAVYATQTISNATLAANWTSGQTFTGYSTLDLKFTFAAAGGRVSRVKVTADEV